MRRWPPTRGAVLLALALVILGGAVLRARAAADPRAERSADEAAYVQIAINFAEHGHYGDTSYHWAPGAPLVFAAAYKLRSGRMLAGHPDIPLAYWEQALAGTLLIAAVFGLAAMLAGAGAGLVAAALVAFYPPLIFYTSDLLSELLGTLALAVAMLRLGVAWRMSAAPARRQAVAFALAGAAFGTAVLVRADLLVLPLLMAAMGGVLVARRTDRRRGLVTGGALLGGTLVVLAPWCIQASAQAGRFVPVTRAGGSSLFIGTYMPANSSKLRLKRSLAAETARRFPSLRGLSPFRLNQRDVLAAVAMRRPDLDESAALEREARANLSRYALRHPLRYARFMAHKTRRMWLPYSHLGGRHNVAALTAYHGALVIVAAVGLLAGLWRTREPLLGAIAVAIAGKTVFHAGLALSEPRYALPLLPLLVAGGVSGAVLAWRSRGARQHAGCGSPALSPVS
jgi:dolichyl-phosphate-mannose-protein mannosyltransferase